MQEAIVRLLEEFRTTAVHEERGRLAAAILEQVYPAMHAYFCQRVSQDAVADLCQDTALAIARGLHKFRGETDSSFWSWCYLIARRRCADFYRSRPRDRAEAISPEELLRVFESVAETEQLSAGDRLDLESTLERLRAVKPPCYTLLVQHYIFGLGYAEMAEELGMEYDAVRMKIKRCLELAQGMAG
jgi:RNA polymerase sigma factor (sigma-70 family)